jgi:hypothetical protein
MKNTKTKKRAVSEANVDERRKEIDDFLLESFAARAKTRRLIEDYLEGKLAPEEDTFE